MRAKHQRTLEKVLKTPTPAGIRWTDIVAMLKAAGVEVSQRSGSRILLKKGAERMVVHRPHPEPETGRATVRDIAAFLKAVDLHQRVARSAAESGLNLNSWIMQALEKSVSK